MIVDPVGSGKSTLLHAVLGELPVTEGTIRTHFTTARFCAQQPFLTRGSLRENIISMYPYEKDWFQTVLYSCDLLEDFASLNRDEDFEIGSKGARLSGGQQRRLVYVIPPLVF